MELELRYNQIVDISPLSSLSNLIELSLWGNDIVDIGPLAYLSSLMDLSLHENHIVDISPLSGLTGLRWVYISGNKVADISPLSGLTNLSVLRMPRNSIADISPLSGMNLYLLDLGRNHVVDISPLLGMTKLWQLDLSDNQIVDISPLSGLTNLQKLSLDRNLVADIYALVENAGVDSGDYVSIAHNCLDLMFVPGGLCDMPDIQALIIRGVDVHYAHQDESCTSDVEAAIDPQLNQRGFVGLGSTGAMSIDPSDWGGAFSFAVAMLFQETPFLPELVGTYSCPGTQGAEPSMQSQLDLPVEYVGTYDRLHVLHNLGNALGVPNGLAAGDLVVRYEDGSQTFLTLVIGVNTAEWAYDRENNQDFLQHSKVSPAMSEVCYDDQGQPFLAHTFYSSIALDPTKEVVSIDFHMSGEACQPSSTDGGDDQWAGLVVNIKGITLESVLPLPPPDPEMPPQTEPVVPTPPSQPASPVETACCLSNGTCTEATVAQCEAMNGEPREGVSCDDAPCPQPSIDYTLTMTVSGSGSTSPSVGTHTYTEGTLVLISATPDAGWVFDHWSGSTSGSASVSSITMTSDKSVTAHFSEIPPTQYTLTMVADGAGSTTPSVGTHTYEEGTSVPIDVTPADGWAFHRWSVNVDNYSSPTTTVLMDSDQVATAFLIELPPPNHIVTIQVEGSGTTNPSAGTYIWDEGLEIPISAQPSTGWEFDHWSGDVDDPNSSSTSVLIDETQVITAHFTEIPPPQYTLTITVDGSGSTSPLAGTHSYDEGAEVLITATPDEGWVFDHWSGDISGYSNPMPVTMAGDKSVTAHFIEGESL